MAWTNFQKSNWTRTVSPQKAVQYFPAATSGIPAGTYTVAAMKVVTYTAQLAFKGNGGLCAQIPFGATLAAGLTLGQVELIAPASGSYGANNHPLLTLQVENITGSNITIGAAVDVLIYED